VVELKMTSRVDRAREAFTKIYDENTWNLEGQPPQLDILARVTKTISDTIQKYQIKSVAEFGCGFWNYAKQVDWTGLTYDGYDVALGPIRYNADHYTTRKIHFHQLVNEVELAPADLLISKDVLHHLPNDDVQHYLAMFKERFSYILLFYAVFPDDNLNGPIELGDYRGLRLDLPPFNEALEIVDEWDNPLFGVPYHEHVVLLRGNRVQPAPETWGRRLVKRLLPL
jgi:hypothetical protein